jgi:hypothetical protein
VEPSARLHTPDARLELERLTGGTVYTITQRKPNTILRLDEDNVVVATGAAPEAEPVPVAWVQTALDRLRATGELQISTESLGRPVGSRSSFLRAVIAAIDGVLAEVVPSAFGLAIRRLPLPGRCRQGSRYGGRSSMISRGRSRGGHLAVRDVAECARVVRPQARGATRIHRRLARGWLPSTTRAKAEWAIRP